MLWYVMCHFPIEHGHFPIGAGRHLTLKKKISHHWVAGSSTGSNANISGQSPAIHSFLLCFHLLISHCIILHHDFGWLDWLEVKVYGSIPPLAGDFRVGFQDPTPPTYAFLGASSSRWPTSRKAKAAPWDRQECSTQNGDLRGGLEPWNFMTFHSVGNVIIPTDEVIFFRGVGQPSTSDFFRRERCWC